MSRDILLRARQHFRNARTVETLRKISVPEWGAEVYFWPEMSLDERRSVYAPMRMSDGRLEMSPAALLDASVAQVCLRSRDAHGNRLFTDSDDAALRDTDPEVLQRIASEMGWGSRASVEDAEKN